MSNIYDKENRKATTRSRISIIILLLFVLVFYIRTVPLADEPLTIEYDSPFNIIIPIGDYLNIHVIDKEIITYNDSMEIISSCSIEYDGQTIIENLSNNSNLVYNQFYKHPADISYLDEAISLLRNNTELIIGEQGVCNQINSVSLNGITFNLDISDNNHFIAGINYWNNEHRLAIFNLKDTTYIINERYTDVYNLAFQENDLYVVEADKITIFSPNTSQIYKRKSTPLYGLEIVYSFVIPYFEKNKKKIILINPNVSDTIGPIIFYKNQNFFDDSFTLSNYSHYSYRVSTKEIFYSNLKTKELFVIDIESNVYKKYDLKPLSGTDTIAAIYPYGTDFIICNIINSDSNFYLLKMIKQNQLKLIE